MPHKPSRVVVLNLLKLLEYSTYNLPVVLTGCDSPADSHQIVQGAMTLKGQRGVSRQPDFVSMLQNVVSQQQFVSVIGVFGSFQFRDDILYSVCSP